MGFDEEAASGALAEQVSAVLLRAAQLPDLTADARARLREWASEASCLPGPSAMTPAEQRKDLWRLRDMTTECMKITGSSPPNAGVNALGRGSGSAR